MGMGRTLPGLRRYARPAAIACALCLLMLVGAQDAIASASPPSVVVSPVQMANVEPSLHNIGHVVAIQSVAVIPRVTAFIETVNVKQGSAVEAGQPLFSLQTAQYQAALQLAEAALASAQAAFANAQLAYQRAAHLGTRGFEAQSNVDQALATRNEDQANVLSAEANIATAKLNLSYCTIAAPISGRIGAVTKTKGNLVTAASGTLVTINQLDPIRIEFAVPTDSTILTHLSRRPGGAPDGERQFALILQLPDGKTYPEKGKITFIDNQVDSATGTVNVYADFPNPNAVLLPGEYVSVITAPVKPKEARFVPATAVQFDQAGNYVLTVNADHKVEQQRVTLGAQIGQNFIVRSGLKAGDNVIVSGFQKVKTNELVATTVSPPPPVDTSNAQ